MHISIRYAKRIGSQYKQREAEIASKENQKEARYIVLEQLGFHLRTLERDLERARGIVERERKRSRPFDSIETEIKDGKSVSEQLQEKVCYVQGQ